MLSKEFPQAHQFQNNQNMCVKDARGLVSLLNYQAFPTFARMRSSFTAVRRAAGAAPDCPECASFPESTKVMRLPRALHVWCVQINIRGGQERDKKWGERLRGMTVRPPLPSCPAPMLSVSFILVGINYNQVTRSLAFGMEDPKLPSKCCPSLPV